MRALLLLLVAASVFADVPVAPPEYGPAPAGDAQIAAAGGMWLAAWSVRSGVAATRIDADGNVLDVPPRALPVSGRVAVFPVDDHWFVFGGGTGV